MISSSERFISISRRAFSPFGLRRPGRRFQQRQRSCRFAAESGGFAAAVHILGLLFAFAAFGAVAQEADDLMLVNCRLSPVIRRIGGKTYTIPGRVVRTTVRDCRIRGGEYTVYDRGDYATSLRFWLAEAEKGNVEAQYYAAKLYEDALDHQSAATWYQKAASAGHNPSRFSLGTLYEKGLGVATDTNKAFNLYRQAAGLPNSFVIVESGEYEALQKAAQDLALREQEIEELQRQLDEAKKQQDRNESRERELQRQLDEERRKVESQKKEIAQIRTLVQSTANTATTVLPSPKRGTLGRFYALVIGNSQYQHLPAVPTAERDARAMEAVLRDACGFQVTTLMNATSAKILSMLYALSQNLAENDNLVVYYAGHGKRDLRNRRGWWLPVDAVADNNAKTNWLPNQEVSDRLALIPARHILVLADASYVGDITRGAPQPEPQSLTRAQWTKYVETTKRKRARLALASGTDGASSRFTPALVAALEKQKGVFPASRIHREVVNALTADERVTSAVPTFAPLQSAFHDGVDFLFERR